MNAVVDSTELPRIGLTMGDAAGIGPEVIVRAIVDSRVQAMCRPVVFGREELIDRASRLTASSTGNVECINAGSDSVLEVKPGTVDARAGRAAHDALIAAGEAAMRGEIDAIVTAPLNKAALHRSGIPVPGHTEILAKLCGVDRFAMMLYLPPGEIVQSPRGLCVAHVTLHTSIASVPALLTTEGITDKIALVTEFLQKIDCASPRIGVCALNPHAGEEGLFGDEETRKISPAVKAAVRAGIDVTGPLPADTLFRRAVRGEFDGLTAMYHDQGHIAFKLIGFDTAVNVTLGLPIVRTSPSHGTAFDIAWTGQAKPDGMIAAIDVAAQLAGKRKSPSQIL